MGDQTTDKPEYKQPKTLNAFTIPKGNEIDSQYFDILFNTMVRGLDYLLKVYMESCTNDVVFICTFSQRPTQWEALLCIVLAALHCSEVNISLKCNFHFDIVGSL